MCKCENIAFGDADPVYCDHEWYEDTFTIVSGAAGDKTVHKCAKCSMTKWVLIRAITNSRWKKVV